MNKHVQIYALVEGQTEKIFIETVVAKHLCLKNISIIPTLLSKPGQKGGDVKFARAKNDIGNFLKQRSDTYLTLMIDFYATYKDWPGLQEAQGLGTALDKASAVNLATGLKVKELFASCRPNERFIPYVSMHEWEALLFSDAKILSECLNIEQAEIEKIISDCGEPESINSSVNTAPSKRLANLAERYKKTSTGVDIAQKIGLQKMRNACPVFNNWLTIIEALSNKTPL